MLSSISNDDVKNGIQISADGTNWKSIIQLSDLTGAQATYPAAVNQIPDTANTIEPVLLDSMLILMVEWKCFMEL